MSNDLTDLYQQVILDHCKNPRNFHALEQSNRTARGHNPLCGDQLKLYLLIESDVIKDVTFVGEGCCISKASASLLTVSLKGKPVTEAKDLFKQVHEMITTGKAEDTSLGKLAVFAGVHKFPARVKCAILPWHAMLSALDGNAETVSTESEDA